MITSSKQMNAEIFWWMVVLAVAALVAGAMLATPLYGQTEPTMPVVSSGNELAAMSELSVGVTAFRFGDYEHARWHFDRAAQLLPTGVEDHSLPVWKALTLQARSDYRAALVAWDAAVVDSPNEVWWGTAVAAAHLRLGELEEADAALDMAADLAPEHPVVYYLSGLLNLERSKEALDYLDAVGPEWFKLASYGRPQILPNSRAMYRLGAMHDLERAVEEAANVCPELPLVPSDWTLAPDLRPTVGDLMTATGTENFEADAHNILGSLYLDASQEELAEEHMDAAQKLGVCVLYGYADLAENYAAAGRHADAARAYTKAYRADPERGSYGVQALKHAVSALRESLLR
jgi:tetratricopeptide (TPR) repeat protein